MDFNWRLGRMSNTLKYGIFSQGVLPEPPPVVLSETLYVYWNNTRDMTLTITLKDNKIYHSGGGLTKLDLNGTINFVHSTTIGRKIEVTANRIYYAGTFSAGGRLYVTDLDGNTDSTFNVGTGFNNTVHNIIEYNDKLYCSGNFTSYQGVTCNRFVVLNLDGSIDTTFNLGTGFNSELYHFIIHNNKLYICGFFTSYQGVACNRFVALNLDGSRDTSFNLGTGFSHNTSPQWVTIYNNKLYICGSFTSYQGVSANRIISLNLDGSIDTTFNVGTGFNNTAARLIVIDDRVYVGGLFTTYKGITRNRIVALDLTGNVDEVFNVGSGFSESVQAIATDGIGNIFVGTSKTLYTTTVVYNGSTVRTLIKLLPNGTPDTIQGTPPTS